MIAILYVFKVKKGQTDKFIEAWKEMTLMIFKNENSLGSRLHQQDKTTYIAYAQWPDRSTWEKSGGNLPETASEIRAKMRESCDKVEILHELEIVEDLLKSQPHDKNTL